jgi:hypothetical protein
MAYAFYCSDFKEAVVEDFDFVLVESGWIKKAQNVNALVSRFGSLNVFIIGDQIKGKARKRLLTVMKKGKLNQVVSFNSVVPEIIKNWDKI